MVRLPNLEITMEFLALIVFVVVAVAMVNRKKIRNWLAGRKEDK